MTRVTWRDRFADLDRRAIGAGALVAVAIALPSQLAFQGLDAALDLCGPGDECESNWVFVFFVVALAGWVAGGYVAGRRTLRDALVHGWLAALAGYAGVQALGIVRNLVAGDDIGWSRLLFNTLAASSGGLLGGVLAERVRARRGRGASDRA